MFSITTPSFAAGTDSISIAGTGAKTTGSSFRGATFTSSTFSTTGGTTDGICSVTGSVGFISCAIVSFTIVSGSCFLGSAFLGLVDESIAERSILVNILGPSSSGASIFTMPLLVSATSTGAAVGSDTSSFDGILNTSSALIASEGFVGVTTSGTGAGGAIGAGGATGCTTTGACSTGLGSSF